MDLQVGFVYHFFLFILAELPNVGDQADGHYGDLAFSRDELLSDANSLTVGKQFSINKVTTAKLLTENFPSYVWSNTNKKIHKTAAIDNNYEENTNACVSVSASVL